MNYEDDPTPHRSRKNTKKWCKGVTGREHVTEIVIPANAGGRQCREGRYSWMEPELFWMCAHVEECVNCGKHVRWLVQPEECPVYVGKDE